MPRTCLEVDIHQLAGDPFLRANRGDGTGWDWAWADWRRDWMDATPGRHAYRCLPLTIVNQTGWWIGNPVGFTATWGGSPTPGGVDFEFDAAADVWRSWITCQFGEGIVTWNTPFLFRTRPRGSRLLVCGPTNRFKPGAHPLTALIESDWMVASFTMNWKLTDPGRPVRFESGEPLLQAIPLVADPCAELEAATVRYRRPGADPETAAAYREWNDARRQFQEAKARGEARPDGWQKDYFRGRDAAGGLPAPGHMSKVVPPVVQYPDPRPPQVARVVPPGPGGGDATTHGAGSGRPPASVPRRVDDDWRCWVAENLALGAPRQGILDAMVAEGFAPADAAREVGMAEASPYLRGAGRARERHAREAGGGPP